MERSRHEVVDVDRVGDDVDLQVVIDEGCIQAEKESRRGKENIHVARKRRY